MTDCHARDVSKNKASVRAEGRMALALPHTAHVVGSQKERGGDAKKTVRSGRSSGRAHGLPINEDTRADVASAQPLFPLRRVGLGCVALRCLISERVGSLEHAGGEERHRRLVLCRCGSGCAGEEMARQWARDPSQDSVPFGSFLFIFLFFYFLFFSFLFFASHILLKPHAQWRTLSCSMGSPGHPLGPSHSLTDSRSLQLARTNSSSLHMGSSPSWSRHVVRGA
jgi:hypothetical protein